MASGPLYLGFDLSTQQLKAIVVASDLTVVSEAKVDFDADFGAKYKITKGVQTNEAEGEVYAPVALWLESLDLVLARLRDDAKCPIDRIKGVSGSAQQHGSVFWNDKASAALGKMTYGRSGENNSKGLLEQLEGVFAHPFAPNWQDHSTQAECDLFDAHLGGDAKLAQATGSSAHHRFTGTQIMRMRRKRPEVYKNSARISLVSSFLASVLLGQLAPLEISDITGMNLWDIANEQWNEPLIELAAGSKDAVADLRAKLGDVPLDGERALGSISTYFVERYGFSKDCQIAPFTGDNPATILALPLRPGDAIVSLGTSTTFLMNTATYKPDPSYHFMNHPTTKGHFMFMLCYKNGGLAREKVRDKLPKPTGQDQWSSFNQAVLNTPPLDVKSGADSSSKAKLGLYFPLPEIVPNVRAGTWRYECTAKDGSNLTPVDGEKAWSPEADARAIVESQALSMRLRSQSLVNSPPPSDNSSTYSALPPQPRRIYLVGGGSLNPAIARVMGDVLGGVDGVYKLDVGGNACALGGAYKAVWTLEKAPGESFDELIGKRWKEEGAIQKVDDGYREGVFEAYGKVLGAFEDMERKVLKEFKN